MPSATGTPIQLWRGPQIRRTTVTPAEDELLVTTDSDQAYTACQLYVGDNVTAGGNRVYQLPYALDLSAHLADAVIPSDQSFVTASVFAPWPKTGRFKFWMRSYIEIIGAAARNGFLSPDIRVRVLQTGKNTRGGAAYVTSRGGVDFKETGTTSGFLDISAGQTLQFTMRIQQDGGVGDLVSAQFVAANSSAGCYEVSSF